MLYFTTNNTNASSETPLILLHGFLESSAMWDYLQFPLGYPVIKIDLPGHGKSKNVDLICNSVEDMAKEVIKVLDELQIGTYHLIGHSMGAYVGLEMKRIDSQLQKMMFLNSNCWNDSPQKVEDRKRVAQIVQTSKSHFIYEVIPNLFFHPEQFDSEVKILIEEAMEMSSDAISIASLAMSKRKDYTHFVRENGRDFTIIQGLEDPVVPLDEMRKLVDGTDIRLVELAAVGHMAHIEAADQVGQIIREFVK